MWYFHALNRRMLLPLAELAKQNATVLDAGCGNGYYLARLRSFFPAKDYAGIDISRELVDLARQYAGIDFALCDFFALPPRRSHDVILMRFIVQHLKDFGMLLDQAARLLRPGGLLMTYSCSGGIGLELFQKIVAGAAVDAGRDARIVRRLAGAADHPVALSFPEGEYLKGLLVQVD